MDFVDIVVHIFQKQTRSHYDIESLWGDAKQTLIESKQDGVYYDIGDGQNINLANLAAGVSCWCVVLAL